MMSNGFIIFIVIVALIAVWLIWSSIKTNKDIKKAFDMTSVDNPYMSYLGLREVLGYCQKNNIEYHLMGRDFLIVEYGEKVITVKRDGGFRLGNSLFMIQK